MPRTPAALATCPLPQGPAANPEASTVRRSASGLLVPSARKSGDAKSGELAKVASEEASRNSGVGSSTPTADLSKSKTASLAAKANALLEARRAAKKAAGK